MRITFVKFSEIEKEVLAKWSRSGGSVSGRKKCSGCGGSSQRHRENSVGNDPKANIRVM